MHENVPLFMRPLSRALVYASPLQTILVCEKQRRASKRKTWKGCKEESGSRDLLSGSQRISHAPLSKQLRHKCDCSIFFMNTSDRSFFLFFSPFLRLKSGRYLKSSIPVAHHVPHITKRFEANPRRNSTLLWALPFFKKSCQ